MAELRRSGEEKWIRPDSKTQVTAEHRIVGGAIVPIRVHTVVISVQHSDDITNEQMREILKEKVKNFELKILHVKIRSRKSKRITISYLN